MSLDQASNTAYFGNNNGQVGGSGVVARPGSTVISGGSASNYGTMSLSGNGLALANQSGAPLRVSGVADGQAGYDAVHFRQLAGGFAAAAAMANLPMLERDRTLSLGVGLGHYQGYTGLALGGQYRFSPNGVAKISVSGTLERNLPYTVGGGVAWSW